MVRMGRSALRRMLRISPMLVAGLVLSNCASVNIPFASLGGDTDAPLVTGSVDTPAEMAPAQTPMPPPLATAVAPAQPATAPQAQTTDNPTEQLVAALEAPATQTLTLSQTDLDAMGAQLTRQLAADPAIGTFPWSVAGTELAGVMTPFRPTRSATNACRMVSVEFTSGARDAIVLADACQQDGRYVFVTPRPGQPL